MRRFGSFAGNEMFQVLSGSYYFSSGSVLASILIQIHSITLWLVLAGTGMAVLGVLVWNRLLLRKMYQHTRKLDRELTTHQKDLSQLRLYETIIALSEDQMVFVDSDYVFRAANKAYLAASNKSAEQVIGHRVEEVVGKAFFDRHIRSRLEQAMRGLPVSFELWADGDHQTNRYLQCVYHPHTDISGHIEGVVAVIHDMTERENIRRTLEESQKSLHRLFGNLRGIAYRCKLDINWPMELISQGCEEVTGYSVQDFYDGNACWGLLTIEEDRQFVWDRICRGVEKRQPFQVEYRIQDRHGQLKWVWEKGCGVFDENGQVLAVEGFITEITDRKQVEEKLTESRNLLQSILDTIPARVFWKDRDLNYLGCNKPFALDAGLASTRQIIGKNDRDLSWQEQVERYQRDDREVIETGRSKLFFEEPQTTPDGRQICLLTSKVPLLSADGHIRGVLGTYQDITDRKQTELAKERLLKEVHIKNEELQSIVFIASHDLRGPLVNIRGFSGELEKSLDAIKVLLDAIQLSEADRDKLNDLLSGEIPESLYFINKSSQKMDTLLKGLLRLSRVGTARLVPATLDINALIREILNSLHFVIRENDIDIVLENNLPACLGDITLTTQVFENIIDNTIKYRHPDRPCRVLVRGSRQADCCLYQIEDNGIGIAPDHREKVFEIFHQLNPDIGGEGLGLTIVRRILERQNGTIQIDSEPEKGTLVSIQLPLP